MTSTQFVLVDVGAVLVAVPVRDVVQGIAWPERLDLLPRRDHGGAARGVFDYLGDSVAMLDLSLWVDTGAGRDGSHRYPRALIVRAGFGSSQQVAIAVDAVRGLHKVAAGAITRISHDDGADEIFHSVARCAGIEGVANVLDVERLMALARTWSGGEAAVQREAAAAEVVATTTYGVVDGDGCRIAFPVCDLLEVLPAPALDPFQSPLTEGLCMWRGRHLPVTSVVKCFPALARADRNKAAPLLAVFERDGLALGVLVDQVPTIRKFQARAEMHQGAALTAIADDGGGLVHLVELAALYSRFPERALSRGGSTPPAAASAAAANAATNACSHIVFDADGVASTPVTGIEAVLPLPPLAPGARHMAWRGQAIALHDLRGQTGAKGTVIVVKGEQAPLGLIVDAVQALVQARAGRVSRLAMAGRGVVDLLTTGAGSGQATYSTRDLAQLARTLGQSGAPL